MTDLSRKCDVPLCPWLATVVLYERGIPRANCIPLYACDAHVDEVSDGAECSSVRIQRPPEPRSNVIAIGKADGARSSIAATLRDIADDIETGRALGVGIVVVLQDGGVGTLVDFAHGQERPFVMLGGVEYLKSRALRAVEEG